MRGNLHSRTRALPGRGPLPAHPRGGTTFLELAFILTILALAAVIFGGMFLAASNQRAIARETSLSAAAARNLIETMRGVHFPLVFSLYNENPDDDPSGSGTAPGHRFLVTGLNPLPDAPDGMNGQVVFPALLTSGGVAELRENNTDGKLGMPRDLNGDSRVDAENHLDDYILLPVRIRIDWRGRAGERSYEIDTMLTDFK